MPSGVINANWFASNLVRKYPLDSNASCIDDHGNYLPDDIIVDLHISYPDNLGTTCYVSAVNVTERLVSIVISVDNTSIAAICIPRPSSMYRYYTMDPLVDGVVALIAIGLDSISTTGSWVFSDKHSSAILPRCCNIYYSISVLSLSRPSDAEPLTGDILLTAGSDLTFKIDTATIDGAKRNVVFLGLNVDENDADTMLKKYITYCQVSTEMDTCKRPIITGIATAIPDCSGNINIISDDIDIGSPGPGILTFKSYKTLPEICEKDNEKPKKGDPRPWNECPFTTEQAPDVYQPCPLPESDSSTTSGGSSATLPNSSSDSSSVSSSTSQHSTSDRVDLYNSVLVIYGGIEYSNLPGFINVTESGDLCCEVQVNSRRGTTWHFTVEDPNINKLNFKDVLLINNNLPSILDMNVVLDSQLSTIDCVVSSNTLSVSFNNGEEHTADIDYTDAMRIILNGIRLESVIYND